MAIDFNQLKDLLLQVEKPSRYTGGEFGMPKAKPSPFQFCMCFPDLYEVGMSNLGIKIVAKSIEERGYTVDFCFTPYTDFGNGLKERNIPLYSLGMREPLTSFHMLGFSLQFELCYTNMLYMLDLAGIPLRREDRKGKNYPLIVVGGPCTINPEPIADFVDIVFIGDGEYVDADVIDSYLACGGATEEFYQTISQMDGVYVPHLMDVIYDDEGKILRFEGKTKVKKCTVTNLNDAPFPDYIPVPNCESVHDRAVVEVMRGCYRGCRFCQAGFLYRPVRPRSVEKVTQQACALIAHTGYDEVSLNSLSTGDYPHLRELIHSLKDHLPQGTSLALPSLRVDSFDSDFAQDSRKISLTFAPEAGSQRLRDVINKDVTEEEILHAATSAFDIGYSAVKLYFMLGLPTETDEDLLEIHRVCAFVKGCYTKEKRTKGLRMSLSVSTFIPKPFTPFQWERQASEEEVTAKQKVLQKAMNIRGCTMNWSDYFTSRLEAVLARGDRRVSKLIELAYRKGCKFDGWDKELNRTAWAEAFEESGIQPEWYTREWGEEEILPWDFIDIGVTKDFFLKERHRAYAAQVTGSCLDGCKGCGMQKICPAAHGEVGDRGVRRMEVEF